jgi:hypothetical protein
MKQLFLLLFLFSGIRAQLPEGVSVDDSDWIPFPISAYEQTGGTILDMAWLLDPPAGSHGFLTVRGERFVFEDGTPARFWGGNFFGEANFPEPEEAHRLADIVARSGANLVRMHHLDVVAPWTDKIVKRSLFGGQAPETTRRLDPVMLDKFDYLIKCFKDRGIYIFLSPVSSRFIRPGDGFPGDSAGFKDLAQGLKLEGLFDPFLITLQKEYLTNLLTHINPYTGNALVNEPAMALIEIINENTLFWIQSRGGFALESDYYRHMLGKQFADWLIRKYGSDKSVLANWKEPGKTALFEGEDLTGGIVFFPHVYITEKEWPVSQARQMDTAQFLFDLQIKYNRDMASFLRKTGLRVPITGSNHWTDLVADLRVNAELDYIDRHSYWTHPEGEYNYIAGQGVQCRPMVRHKWGGHIGENARKRIKDRPFTISEWHNPLPNPYRAEGPPLMAAYACLHNWHPMQYAYWGSRSLKADTINSFEAMFDPTQMNLLPICALMFHRQDFKEDRTGYTMEIKPDQIFESLNRLDLHPELALIGKTGLCFTDLSLCRQVPPPDKKIMHPSNDFISVTGELLWNTDRGQVIFDAPRTQGVVGFIGGQHLETQDIIFELCTPFGVVLVSSLTGNDIGRSDHLLISTSGDARFTDVAMSADFKKVEKTGHFPFMMQPVEGVITIKTESPVEIWKISSGGQRLGSAPMKKNAYGTCILLKAENQAMHYEVVSN